MPRPLRYALAGVPQHIVQRGNNRSATFFHEQDYRTYLGYLRDAAQRHQVAVHAYVLMTNHIHLLVTPDVSFGVSKLLQSVGRRYVQWVNLTHGRTGTLWEGRHKASVIQSEDYLLSCQRYIELNPVRANMVRDPGDYPWSSYRCHAFGHEDPLLQDHPLYLGMGPTPEQRQAAYRELFRSALPAETVCAIKTATERCGIYGNDRFRKEVEKHLNRRAPRNRRGRPPKKTPELLADY